MLALTLWLLASPPAPPESAKLVPRWTLELELPRRVEVLGVGTVPIEVHARYLLRGHLHRAQVERCALEVRSALATAIAQSSPPREEAVRLRERGGEVELEDTGALLPTGQVRFSLKIGGFGIQEMSGETHGRLSLQGQRSGDRIEGVALLLEPRDRVSLPSGLPVRLAPETSVRGRFVLLPSAAARCDELVDPKGAVAWVP